tara:strand:+ start:404 stop:631 length:228 start_codon:yes stop_codon:yes gene_type:complete
MTQEEFNKAPLLDQVLWDCNGMLVENHPDIKDVMEQYASKRVIEELEKQVQEYFKQSWEIDLSTRLKDRLEQLKQ